MDCRGVFERLSEDVDGELSASDAELVRRHVLSCAACARQRRLLESTREAFRATTFEPARSSFDDEVFRRLRSRRASGWWLSAAAGLAAALGFLVLRNPAPIVSTDALFHAAPDAQPGWSAGQVETGVETAVDCGLLGTVVCHVEAACGTGQCS